MRTSTCTKALIWLYFLSAVGLGMYPIQAISQDEEVPQGESILEEVIVSARYRKESIQESPVSVTAFSNVTLEKMTAGDAELLADVAVIFVRLLPDLDARLRYGIENRESQELVRVLWLVSFCCQFGFGNIRHGYLDW